MTDAGAMIILGITMITRGISYHRLGTFILVYPLDTHLPIWLTSGYWIGLGTTLIVASWWQATPAARVILAAPVNTRTLWSSLFIFAPPAAFHQLGAVYLGLAAIVIWAVWRGRRGEIRVGKEPPDDVISH